MTSSSGASHITLAVDIFVEACQACRNAILMTPRSPNDKEYVGQDWFEQRLQAIGLAYVQQGRNSYPDFIVNGACAQLLFDVFEAV